ncbi:TMEM175 family protein [Cryobacterium sp. SO2]|uniref:TMEM175 family protein n=1 Tax=Cryobacterium sp. SO2 TaxID=1897060 RepID=UPI00223E5AF7|nr:TMEM175 family protein [Cryobacterium sp. SO2]WEO75754.1 TMEM175 family protein [Cryobacterium sp. SO2]
MSDDGGTGRRTSQDRRTVLSTRRLEAYTDGVFAIAATLLVLNLSVDGIGAVRTNAELVHQVSALAPSILNVVISFLLLGLLWLIHVRQFEFIPRVDTTIIWLNNLRLLAVVLVPFTTSLNDEFSRFLIGRTLLPVNFFLIVFFSTWQWFHASSPRRRLVQGASAEAVHNGRVNAASALAQALGVVLLATVFGSWAFLLFAVDPLVALVLRRIGVIKPTPDGVVVG